MYISLCFSLSSTHEHGTVGSPWLFYELTFGTMIFIFNYYLENKY